MNFNFRLLRILPIVLVCLTSTAIYSQNTIYDSLKNEVFTTLDNVTYNFDEYINRQKLAYPKPISILGFDAKVLYKYSDTLRNIDFDTRWFTKEWREKDAFFRNNLVKIVDEYATKNNLKKVYKELEIDKKDKRESGIRALYEYFDSIGHKIVGIYDVQKKQMNVMFYNYPNINIANNKKRKEQDEKAALERQLENDYKALMDELDAKLRIGEQIVQSEKKAIAAGGLFAKAVKDKIDKVTSGGDAIIDSFIKKYQEKIPDWMLKGIKDKWRPTTVN